MFSRKMKIFKNKRFDYQLICSRCTSGLRYWPNILLCVWFRTMITYATGNANLTNDSEMQAQYMLHILSEEDQRCLMNPLKRGVLWVWPLGMSVVYVASQLRNQWIDLIRFYLLVCFYLKVECFFCCSFSFIYFMKIRSLS